MILLTFVPLFVNIVSWITNGKSFTLKNFSRYPTERLHCVSITKESPQQLINICAMVINLP